MSRDSTWTLTRLLLPLLLFGCDDGGDPMMASDAPPVDTAMPHNLRAKSSGLCLRAETTPTAGTRIVQDVCSTRSLVFVDTANGAGIEIAVENTDLCVTAVTTTLADVNGVMLAPCDKSAKQIYVPTEYPGDLRSFRLVDTTICADVLNASATVGDPLGLWTCGDSDPQKFTATPPATTDPIAVPDCTKYVAQTGTLNGSTAYTSVQAGIDTLFPGDVLCVGPGTYQELLRVDVSGTATAPIVIRAFDLANKPVIDGAYALPSGPASNAANCQEYAQNPNANLGPYPLRACQAAAHESEGGGVLVAIQGSYITWDSIDIIRSRTVGVLLGNNSGDGWYVVPLLDPAHGTWYSNIKFVRSRVEGTRNMGMFVMYVDGVELVGNTILDTNNFAKYDRSPFSSQSDVTMAWSNGIGVGGAKNLVMTDNVIGEGFGEGIQLGGFTYLRQGQTLDGQTVVSSTFNRVENATIKRNTFFNTWSSPLYVGNVDGAVIEENVVFGSSPTYGNAYGNTYTQNCVVFGSEEGSGYTRNVRFANNVVAGCTYLLDLRQYTDASDYANLSFFHNTFINPAWGEQGSVIASSMTRLTNLTFVNNLIYAPGDRMISTYFGFTAATNMTVRNNLWTTTPSHVSTNSAGTQVGLSGMGDVISASPGLVNPSYMPAATARSFDLDTIKLNAGSPAFNAGISVPTVPTDRFGTARPSTPDLGAYQH